MSIERDVSQHTVITVRQQGQAFQASSWISSEPLGISRRMKAGTLEAKWQILQVYCPEEYLPPKEDRKVFWLTINHRITCISLPNKGWFSKGSFLMTSMPSPPPVSFLEASATEYSWATWYWKGQSQEESSVSINHVASNHPQSHSIDFQSTSHRTESDKGN